LQGKIYQKNYGTKVTDYQNKALDLAKTEAYFFTIILFVIGLLNVAIIWIGGQKYIAGELSIGKIAFFHVHQYAYFPFLYGWLGNFCESESRSFHAEN
jgi:ATP-binding cassette subfamily B protein